MKRHHPPAQLNTPENEVGLSCHGVLQTTTYIGHCVKSPPLGIPLEPPLKTIAQDLPLRTTALPGGNGRVVKAVLSHCHQGPVRSRSHGSKLPRTPKTTEELEGRP